MESIEQLLEWSKGHGASIDPKVLFIQISNGNIGALAEASDLLSIKVPVKTIVKLSDAVNAFDFDAALLIKKTKNINGFAKLFLAHENVPENLSKSFFQPYIASLPTSQQINSPYVWLPEDQKLLSGSNLGNSLKENLFNLIEEWWLVISLLPDSHPKPEAHFMNMKFYYEYKFYEPQQLYEYLNDYQNENWTSFPAYLWALMIYKSRSFPCKLLKDDPEVDQINFVQDDVAMLIPVIDLLNHDPKAQVTWGATQEKFVFEATAHSGGQLYNNYGRKGNEELLLAYGFCLKDNASDSVALKIKVPAEILSRLEEFGVALPSISDYTTSIVNEPVSDQVEKLSLDQYDQYKDGLLYFIGKENLPESLLLVFYVLLMNSWEKTITPRLRLSGLNHLRQALESKSALLANYVPGKSANAENVATYLTGQKAILKSCVAKIKEIEKSEMKAIDVFSLKSIYKKDMPFAQSLMVTMGVTCYNDILEQELMDQIWLLFLIRCYNMEESPSDDPEDERLFSFIRNCFIKMDKETEISAQEVLQFQELYQNLILPMNQAVPEIYNKGKWTVRELIVSARLLDTIGFVRGKKQECHLVYGDYK